MFDISFAKVTSGTVGRDMVSWGTFRKHCARYTYSSVVGAQDAHAVGLELERLFRARGRGPAARHCYSDSRGQAGQRVSMRSPMCGISIERLTRRPARVSRQLVPS
jgi:hypothetical protein